MCIPLTREAVEEGLRALGGIDARKPFVDMPTGGNAPLLLCAIPALATDADRNRRLVGKQHGVVAKSHLGHVSGYRIEFHMLALLSALIRGPRRLTCTG